MRLFYWWTIALVPTTGLVLAQADVQVADLASVKISICTTFGEPIPLAQVTLSSIGPKVTFTGRGGQAKFERIPYGLYDLDVRLLGFLPRKERIRIYQRNLVLQIGLVLAPTHVYERPEVTGTIKSAVSQRSSLWVRLVALYTSDLAENAVDGSGSFEMDGMAPGKYVLLLFQMDKVVATKSLEILGGKQNIEITLEP